MQQEKGGELERMEVEDRRKRDQGERLVKEKTCLPNIFFSFNHCLVFKFHFTPFK